MSFVPASTMRPGHQNAVFLVAALVAVMASVRPAPAKNGEIIESTVVVLDRETVGKIAQRQSDIETTLKQVEIRAITYRSDSLRVKGYLVAPVGDEKLPCVIYNRGGSADFGMLNDMRAGLFLARVASWGYIVVASNYRGNGGGEGKEEFGGRDIDDVLNLFALLEGLPRADVTRIGMMGWSRGGLMTCLALARTDRIKAAVIGGGLYDSWRTVEDRRDMETEVYSKLIPDWATNRKEALDVRSPVLWADRLCKETPLLLLHGAQDSRVSPREAIDMASRLLDSHHPFRLVMFEGAEHGIREHQSEVDRLSREWLDRFVRDGKPWSSEESREP
jgi:dipeptidyl aminopeptidase/acylaminoacyl peptidase